MGLAVFDSKSPNKHSPCSKLSTGVKNYAYKVFIELLLALPQNISSVNKISYRCKYGKIDETPIRNNVPKRKVWKYTKKR